MKIYLVLIVMFIPTLLFASSSYEKKDDNTIRVVDSITRDTSYEEAKGNLEILINKKAEIDANLDIEIAKWQAIVDAADNLGVKPKPVLKADVVSEEVMDVNNIQ